MARPVRSRFGAWWVVTLCEGRSPAMAVGVSALATDVRLASGTLEFPPVAGVEFEALAMPPGAADGVEYRAPEYAVQRAYALTGRRVRAVPTLIAARAGLGSALTATWRLELERPVRLRGQSSQRNLDTAVVFIGMSGAVAAPWPTKDGLVVPEETQPTDERFVGFRDADLRTGVPVPLPSVARRQPDTPIVFERANADYPAAERNTP